MKKMRIISAVLCICMLFSISALAASVDPTGSTAPTGSTTIETPDVRIGARSFQKAQRILTVRPELRPKCVQKWE